MHVRHVVLTSVLALAACAEPAPRPASFASSVAPASPAFRARVVGHGPPMILIPGLACSGDVWQGTIDRYAASHELHVLTLAGFAGVPAVEGERGFLDRVTADLAAYVTSHRLVRPVVVGHSLGGVIAYDLAERRPDLVGAVIAVDAAPFLPAMQDESATADAVKPIAARLRDKITTMQATGAHDKNVRTLKGMISNPANVERAAAWEDASDPATMGRAVFDVMTTDLRPGLAKVKAPVLVVAAGVLALPVPAEEVRAAYEKQLALAPDHQVVVAPGAKHFVMLDDPDFFYRAVDTFLVAKAPR